MTYEQNSAIKIDYDRMVKHIRKIQRQKKIDEWFKRRHERKLESDRRYASMTQEDLEREHPIFSAFLNLICWILLTFWKLILYVFYVNPIGRWGWRLYFSFKCFESLLIGQWVMFFVYAAVSIFWLVLVDLIAYYTKD